MTALNPIPTVFEARPTLRLVASDEAGDQGETSASPTLAPPGPDVVPAVDPPGVWPALRLWAMPDAMPFPVNVLAAPVADFVEAASRSFNCPPEFAAIPVLVTAGAAIGRSVALQLKDGYRVSPSLYAMNVGGPSSGKSPALKAAVRPLAEIDRRLYDEFKVAKARFEADSEVYEREDDPDVPRPIKPTLTSTMVEDITTEALAQKLANNPRGLLMSRDEGSAFVASLGQYKGGRGSDRQMYMSLLYGTAICQERKGHPDNPIRVPSPCLSVIGNLPPDMIASFRDEAGRSDGFLERILFGFPEPLPRTHWNEDGLPDEVLKAWASIIERLVARPMIETTVGPEPLVIRFSDEARGEWIAWYNRNVDQGNAGTPEANDPAADNKLCDFAARLALILHLLAEEADSMGRRSFDVPPVSLEAVRGAIRLWSYFRCHNRRVRAFLTGQRLAIAPRGAKLIHRWIENHPEQSTFSEGEISRAYPPSRGYEAVEMEDGLKWLADRSCIRPLDPPASPVKKRGRRASQVWQIHPDFLSKQAKQEIQGQIIDGADSPHESASTPGASTKG